ncbi:MAG: hypothetical protein OXI96_04435 [Acidimicrobiaceae bacterium]|nr:hypothetical protein [Acidimicrobiaceae bacterium]
MPGDRTLITELVTALGMTGCSNHEAAIREQPAALAITADDWESLKRVSSAGAYSRLACVAFQNGVFFANHHDGLNGRVPQQIEWSGGRRIPGDQPVPADLLVDRVYMISCKYLSRILYNTSPARIFDEALGSTFVSRYPDWYQLTAPKEHDALYRRTITELGLKGMPETARKLDTKHRLKFKHALKKHQEANSTRGVPAEARTEYKKLIDSVSRRTAVRWRKTLQHRRQWKLMLWRLLRIYSSTYFILGIDLESRQTMRLRVMTPWEWQKSYKLLSFELFAASKGQPRVDWVAEYLHRPTENQDKVCGHIEIRWSHGPFMGAPEAKAYLDTPHQQVPGYEHLAMGETVNSTMEATVGPAYRYNQLILKESKA